jgi:anti-sigma factor RsiW
MSELGQKKVEHESIRQMLPLAAAGALDENEQRALEQHVADCSDCAAEMENWNGLAIGLKRLPTPQAPALLVERARARVVAEMAKLAERRNSHWMIAFLVLFAWAVTFGTWPIVRLFSDGLLSWLDLGFNHTWFGVAMYSAAVWVTAGVAAAVLGLRKHREGGLA